MYCVPYINTLDIEETPDMKNRKVIEYVRGACAVRDNVPYENEFHWEGGKKTRTEGVDIWEPPPP